MAGALFVARGTAGAQIELDPVEPAFPQLDNRLLGARGVAVVALEAIAAGEAAGGFVARLGLRKAGDDLVEARAFRHRQLGVLAACRVEKHGQIELLVRDRRVLRRLLVDTAPQPRIDVARRLLAVPDGRRHRPRAADHVAAREDAGGRAHVLVHFDDVAPADAHVGHLLQELDVGVLSDGQHQRIGLERLEPPRSRAARAVGQHLHLFDHDLVLAELLDRRQPLDLHAFGEGFHRFIGMGLHLRLVVAEDDHGLLGAEPLGHARGIHRGVAAADDADDAPECGCAALFHALHERDGIDNLAAIHGRNIEVVGDLGADPEEHGIERARGLFGQHVVHAGVAKNLHPHRLDARDFLVEPLTRQAVCRNSVVHHAARLGVRIADLDVVSEPAQLVGARQAGRAGADDEHALAGGLAGSDRPSLLVGRSPRNRSSEWMETAESRNCRLQALSQG